MHADIWTDGGGNTGYPCSCACVIVLEENTYERAKKLPDTTNNIAEFEGILLAVETAVNLGVTSMKLYSDSLLCIHILKGIRNPNKFSRYKSIILKLSKSNFNFFEFNWVSRIENKRADGLCREVILYQDPSSFYRLVPSKPLRKRPSIKSDQPIDLQIAKVMNFKPKKNKIIEPTGSDPQIEEFIESFKTRFS